jgi:peptidoglycan/xylan/chitin deacetylase (PgdA/CDA1 family)
VTAGSAQGAPPRTVPVLLYHSVSAEPTGLMQRYTLSPPMFRQHIAWIVENGFDTLTVSDYAMALRGQKPWPPRPLVVTFDDGYADFLTEAAPVLAERGIVSTLYVTTRPIGRTRRGTMAGRPMLTWSELSELPALGVEIGGHSHDHAQLDLLARDRVIHQVETCKQALEDHLQVRVDSFAYPHGYNSATTRRAVRSADYTSACGVGNALSHPRDDQWSIARLMFEHDDGVDRLRRACVEAADPLGTPGDTPVKRAWRIVRRTRVRLHPETWTPPTTDGD